MGKKGICQLIVLTNLILFFSFLLPALPSFGISHQELYQGGIGALSKVFYPVEACLNLKDYKKALIGLSESNSKPAC
jgi:hypothetical protein